MQKKKFAFTLREWISKLLLLVFSVIFAILICEVALRFSRYRYHFITYPLNYMCLDDNGIYDISKNHPVVFTRQPEYDCVLWSNELGCFDKPYAGGKNHILLVGDSFTFGHAPFEDKYGTLLEEYLDYRVLKCGVSGYGPMMQLYKIKKIMKKTNAIPQLIISGYWMGNALVNDLEYLEQGVLVSQATDHVTVNHQQTQSLFKPAYSLLHPSLSLKRAITNWVKKHSLIYYLFNKNDIVRAIAAKIGFVDVLFQNYEFVPLQEHPWLEGAWEFHLNNIRQIKEFADSYKARLLVVLIPANVQVYDFLRPKGNYDFGQPNRILSGFFRKEGIDYLDLTSGFRICANQNYRHYLDNQGDLYWRQDEHFNKRGNRLAAILIARYIIESGLLEIQDNSEKKINLERELQSFLEYNKSVE